ncbi:MAG: cyclic nucleotide-binding domain-containing protein [Xanthobacteraceae bacterium]
MTIEDDIAFFERVPTLNLLGRAALRILAIGAESRYVHSGEVLFSAGEQADSGFVVQEGKFRLTPQESEGERTVTVGAGTLFGELAMLTETTRPVTATALEPSTVLRIPRTLFLRMLEGYPDAARRLRDLIASRTDQSARDIYNVRTVLDEPERR